MEGSIQHMCSPNKSLLGLIGDISEEEYEVDKSNALVDYEQEFSSEEEKCIFFKRLWTLFFIDDTSSRINIFPGVYSSLKQG